MNKNPQIINQIKDLMSRIESNDTERSTDEKFEAFTQALNNIISKYDESNDSDFSVANIETIINNHEGLVCVKDLGGKYVAVNNLFAHYYGVTDTEFYKGKTDANLYPNQDVNVFKSHDERLINTQIPFSIEEIIEFPGRSPIIVQAFKAPYYNVSGKIIGTIGFLRDITKIKYLEQQNVKLLKAIEQSTATIVITDKNGLIEYVNPQFTKLTGYTADEAKGLNPSVLKSGLTSAETYDTLWQTITSGKEWKGEFCNKKKNGELFWESAVISPVFNTYSEITNFIAVKDNITLLKEREADLIRMSDLQELLTSISIRNINVDQNEVENSLKDSLAKISRFVNADRALIFKYDWENKSCLLQYEWHETGFDEISADFVSVGFEMLQPWIEKHSNKQVFYIPCVSDYQGKEADELKQKSVKTMISVPFFVNDTCLGFISFDSIKESHTYTDKEMALLQVFGQIYASLIQRSNLESNLKQEIDNAQKANQSKSEFLANMSHELRTPLNGVIGFSELLMHTDLNSVQLQYTSAINTSAKALLGVVNEILDFSKIEAGKIELEIEKSDIIHMIEQSIDIVKFSAEKKGIELLLNIPDILPRYAFIDAFRVSQILINLLSNAVKFTQKGEVELKIEFVAESNDSGTYTFTVRDTGIGISDENKIKLFRAFGQADTSTTRKFGGTGLGLIISEKLARKMDSHITFDSVEGKGSTFGFSLNVLYESDSEVFAEKIENIHKVLVVDDNFMSRVLIQKMFTNWGIETVICDSTAEAVFILQMGVKFDLVIVDNLMNENDAVKSIITICKRLAVKVDKLNFMILHSSSADVKFFEECNRLGIKHLIEKPVRYDKMFQYLKSIGAENNDLTADCNETVVETKPKLNVSKKVLVADDDMFNMMLAKAMINNILPGTCITEAQNGKIAYEKIISENFDLVFMDVQMPELDGNEATRKIREYEMDTKNHTVIVGLTAGALNEERQKCFESGMDEFLTKPIEVEKLRQVILKYLN